MTYRLTWLPTVLRDAGLKVVEVSGWQTRGHGDVGRIIGVICHHTAYPSLADNDDVNVVKRGRPDLKGPLSQLVLGRDGTYYMIAAGKAWHAGVGKWKGVTAGNNSFIGIEACQRGYIKGPKAELWAPAQIDAYQKGCAAILDYIKQPVTQCIGHKEWAPGRKTDPTFSMPMFRDGVAFYMDNPKGTWRGALDRMAARMTSPNSTEDGCRHDDVVGQKGKVVLC